MKSDWKSSSKKTREDAWLELGRILPGWIREAEESTERAWRDQLTRVLDAGGVPDDHPLRSAARELRPEVRGPDFALTVLSGGIGELPRAAAEEADVLRSVRRIWAAIEEERPDNRWQAFWESIAEELPETPHDALEKLAAFREEATRAVKNPTSTWPMQPTGTTEAELVDKALHELAARAGISRDELPGAPEGLDRPAMIATDTAEASRDIHEWLATRETWGRVLGRLAPWLCLPTKS